MALKPTSEIFTIGAKVTESAPNVFTEQRIDLQLNPLDNEVLAIYAVDIQNGRPEFIDGVNTEVRSALYTTTQTSLPGIDQSGCLAEASDSIAAVAAVGGVAFQNRSMSDTPPSGDVSYIGLVATSDLFFGIDGALNVNAKTARVKIWARRMRCDAATYSALVQSELLSN